MKAVADAVLRASEHPARDLVVGGAAKALLVSQAISPRLLDAVMKRIGFEIHYTNEPKSEDAPDNLFAPIENHDIIEGSFATGRIPEASTPGSDYTLRSSEAPPLGTTLGVPAILQARL